MYYGKMGATWAIIVLSILFSIQFCFTVYKVLIVRQYWVNKIQGRSDAHSRKKDKIRRDLTLDSNAASFTSNNSMMHKSGTTNVEKRNFVDVDMYVARDTEENEKFN